MISSRFLSLVNVYALINVKLLGGGGKVGIGGVFELS